MEYRGDLRYWWPVVRNLPTTKGIWPRMKASGPGIPAGAIVLSVDSPTQVTLSMLAVENTTQLPIKFEEG